jgi:hypothetical protein
MPPFRAAPSFRLPDKIHTLGVSLVVLLWP